MRKLGRTDVNQKEIVQALRDIGASVESLAGLGSGVPDLLVGFRGEDFLLEVKAAKGKLTDDQWKWHARWSGKKPNVVRSVEEAFRAVGASVTQQRRPR